MGKNIDPDQKDAIIQRGRMKDLERARNRAMRLIRDDQKEEWGKNIWNILYKSNRFDRSFLKIIIHADDAQIYYFLWHYFVIVFSVWELQSTPLLRERCKHRRFIQNIFPFPEHSSRYFIGTNIEERPNE